MNQGSGAINPAALTVILCIAGAFVGAVIYAARSNARRKALLQRFAASQGWSFQAADGDGLSARIEAFFPDELFQLDNITTIETGARAVRFFDCQYRLRERRSGGSFGTGCILESPRFRSLGTAVDIVARSRINAAALTNRVDVGDAEFSKTLHRDREGPVVCRARGDPGAAVAPGRPLWIVDQIPRAHRHQRGRHGRADGQERRTGTLA